MVNKEAEEGVKVNEETGRSGQKMHGKDERKNFPAMYLCYFRQRERNVNTAFQCSKKKKEWRENKKAKS